MHPLLRELRHPDPDLFVVSHSGARAGGPMVLLRFLRWLHSSTSLDVRVALLHGGGMEGEFTVFDARILGGAGSRLWMLQRGLANLGLTKPAGALAMARLGPTMLANRKASMIFLNSVGALPALRFLPEGFDGKVVLWTHELDMGFEKTIGPFVWKRQSPRIDHFVVCSDAVGDLLVSKGIDEARITCHRGFIERSEVSPAERAAAREALGIPPHALVVGASGRPDWRKAPEQFVHLAKALDKRRGQRDIHFVWVGGPMSETGGWRIVHDFEGAGLKDRFHLTDELLDPASTMAAFDVFALTSREDPYPLAMIEAAALGVPIVSFDNGGVVELAAAGGDQPLAEVVPYLDVDAMATTVLRLFDHPEQRAALASRAQAHVLRTHLVDHAAPRLLDTLVAVEPKLGGRAVGTAGASAA